MSYWKKSVVMTEKEGLVNKFSIWNYRANYREANVKRDSKGQIMNEPKHTN